MKSPRQELLDVLNQLPEDASIETLLGEIAFKASVMRGLDDARRGDVVSHEEVRTRLNKWLESSGRERLSAG
jgi:predicted transcriptional regulator